MTDQEERAVDKHTSVSNAPEEQEVPVHEAQVSDPYEGGGFERAKEELTGEEKGQGEEVPGYEQMNAQLKQALTEPGVSVVAPETTGLRDIAEASFGSRNPDVLSVAETALKMPPGRALPATESVILPDDRIQITDTANYPWRVHADLVITAADNSRWGGTGFFIGPHTLATAGHCVFIHAPGATWHGWVRSIQVMPGRNGSLLPYGSITSTDFRSVTGWTNSGDDNYDYGAIRTPTELGNTVGWLGIAAWPDNELVGLIGNLSGYPGDKPDGTQWYHSRRIASVTSRRVYYDIDTFSGQSGSAVYRLLDGRRHAFAIHTLGTSPGQPMNSGTRIVTPVYNNLVAWIA